MPDRIRDLNYILTKKESQKYGAYKNGAADIEPEFQKTEDDREDKYEFNDFHKRLLYLKAHIESSKIVHKKIDYPILAHSLSVTYRCGDTQMEFFDVIFKRRSIRAYEKKPVEDEKLHQVLKAARRAPSANNMQEWKFVVVRDKLKIEKLTYACKQQSFVNEAPVIIVACAVKSDYIMTCGQYAYTIDLSIAMTHMMLAATALDLGTCWLGAFFEDKVKKILKIPDDIRVVGILTLGYPRFQPQETNRKQLGEIVSFDKWG
jgi:nitroreductase